MKVFNGIKRHHLKEVQYLITSNKHQYIQDGAVHLIMSLKLQVRRMQPLSVVSDVRI